MSKIIRKTVIIIFGLILMSCSSNQLLSNGKSLYQNGRYQEALSNFNNNDDNKIDDIIYKIKCLIMLERKDEAVLQIDNIQLCKYLSTEQSLEIARMLYWKGKYLKDKREIELVNDEKFIKKKYYSKDVLPKKILEAFTVADSILNTELKSENTNDHHKTIYILKALIESTIRKTNLFSKDKENKSKIYFDEAQKLFPSSFDFFFAVAMERNAYEEFADSYYLEKAIKELDKFEGDFSIFCNDDYDFAQLKTLDKIIYHYRRGLNLGEALHFENTAIKFLEEQNYAEAKRRIKKSLEMNDVVEKLHYSSSIINWYTEDYNIALKDINDAIEDYYNFNDPKPTVYSGFKVRILHKLGRSREINELLANVENNNEGGYFDDQRYHLSRYYFETSQITQAIETISSKIAEIEDNDSYSALPFITRAHYYLVNKEFEKALNDLKKANKGNIYSSFSCGLVFSNTVLSEISTVQFSSDEMFVKEIKEEILRFGIMMGEEFLDSFLNLSDFHSALDCKDYEYILQRIKQIKLIAEFKLINDDIKQQYFLYAGLAAHDTKDYKTAIAEFENAKRYMIQDSVKIDNGIFDMMKFQALNSDGQYRAAQELFKSLEPTILWSNIAFYLYALELFKQEHFDESLEKLVFCIEKLENQEKSFNKDLEENGLAAVFISFRDFSNIEVKNMQIDLSVMMYDPYDDNYFPFSELYVLQAAILFIQNKNEEFMNTIRKLDEMGMKDEFKIKNINKILLNSGQKIKVNDSFFKRSD